MVTRIMGFHGAKYGLPGLSVLDLGRGTGRTDRRTDKQTDDGHQRLMPLPYGGRGHNK